MKKEMPYNKFRQVIRYVHYFFFGKNIFNYRFTWRFEFSEILRENAKAQWQQILTSQITRLSVIQYVYVEFGRNRKRKRERVHGCSDVLPLFFYSCVSPLNQAYMVFIAFLAENFSLNCKSLALHWKKIRRRENPKHS